MENVFESGGAEICKQENLTCKEDEDNIFTPKSITIGGCIKNTDKRRIIISGELDNIKKNLSITYVYFIW